MAVKYWRQSTGAKRKRSQSIAFKKKFSHNFTEVFCPAREHCDFNVPRTVDCRPTCKIEQELDVDWVI
jgi:hypothetical protein